MTEMTLAEAREWLRERVDEGARCPCCEQFAKVYRRKIHSTMARDLISWFRREGTEWVHIPTLLATTPGSRPGQGGDLLKCVYWGLIEPDDGVREDGSSRTGWWRITDRGELFVRSQAWVPKYARIYDGRLLNLVGIPVGIRDALGDKFNYDELMRT